MLNQSKPTARPASRRRSLSTPSTSRRVTPAHPSVRVLVADAQPLYCDALARTVRAEPGLELVDALSDAAELRPAIPRLRPHVVVVDRDLLDPTAPLGLDSSDEGPRLLVLAARVDAADVYASIEGGASGYLSKDSSGDALCRAIVAIARGEILLDVSAQTLVAREIRLRGRDDRPLLSGREQEVLVLIADGQTAPQIGRLLHLSTATVKTHILHLYEKLGVTERAAAVAEAMRRGLIE
jgi:two-component system, NarL family, nitrate/nitrite response regulator NarL